MDGKTEDIIELRMKKYLLSMLSTLMLLAWTSCEDYNKEYLDEAVTTLYIKNSGEVPLTLYRAGMDDIYKVVVDKAGYDLTAETDAKIILLNQTDLDIYSQEQGTAYKLLPADCYVLPADLNCRFGSDDLYNTFDLTLKTEAIYNLLAIPSDDTYVLPLQLVASNDSIHAGKNYLFLMPKVEVPTVYFNKTGFINNPVSVNDPAQTITLTLPVELIIDNQWSFDCTVSVSETLLADFNAQNNTAYRLLPAGVYTINPTVQFVPGTSLANVEIAIDRTQLGLGTYILPLQLDNVSNEYFQIDPAKNVCLFGISYTPPREDLVRVPLTESMITVASVPVQEGSVAALCDNDPTTYFHSRYSDPKPWDAVYGSYIDVVLPGAVNSIALDYDTRHNNANGAPKRIKLYGSMDGTTWDLLGILQDGLPTVKAQTYSSAVFSSPNQFNRFRFAVIESAAGKLNQESPAYYALGELKLWAK
jgi:hypothetical protein